MTDFYSVLKTSIIRRGLKSQADRLEVYDQARKAMIRKLWSFNPPLAEDEIDTRIGLFDAAVERIEGDLQLEFAEAEAQEARRYEQSAPRQRAAAESYRQQPMVYEGYDEDADYAPAFGGRSSRQTWETETQAPNDDGYEEMPAARHRYDDWSTAAETEEPPHQRTASVVSLRPRRRDDRWDEPEPERETFAEVRADPLERDYGYAEPEEVGTTDNEEAYADVRRRARSYPEPVVGEPEYDEEAPADPSYRRQSYDDADQWREAPEVDRRRTRRPPSSRWEGDSPSVANDDIYDEGEDRYAVFDRGKGRPRKGKKRKAAKARPQSNKTVRILTIAVAGLAAILIAFNAYVFIPIIFVSESPPAAETAAPPTKIADRVPVAGAPALSATRIANDSATATEIPTRNLDVTESLVVFDGRDPTVFDATSNNPIQFDSDAEGGFARISSATTAAGARAVIGPGLAKRLAGQTIRITILARASLENGAAAMRFAYQSGLAISHWQSADLSSSYGSYGMIWRVPAAHGSSAGDYLLIEPGIPGDGTSTDIRSIRIDILAS